MRLAARHGLTYNRIIRPASSFKLKSTLPLQQHRLKRHKRQRVSFFSQTAYQDPTLVWAQANPRLAQECLNPPPPPVNVTSPSSTNMVESFEAYLEWRRWKFPEEITDKSADSDFKDPRENAKALVSHILSAPLTLASQSKHIIQHCANGNTKNDSLEFNWCCVGARAEASIPLMYWKEFLMSSRASLVSEDCGSFLSKRNLAISLDFIGPDIPPKLSEQSVVIPEGQVDNNDSYATSLFLRGCHRGYFHENPVKEKLNSWDAFLLFNPGLGHSNLQKSWEPTLNLILDRGHERTSNTPRVLLLTAHSEHDMDRDAAILTKDYGLKDISYRENPFASRIAYEDPFEKNHFVRPNHYIATVVI